jgi:putative Holliday junction resolvase
VTGRVMAVDPGDKRLGIAISDLTGTIANPLLVVEHIQRQIDAATIVQLAVENEVVKIVIGQALDMEDQATHASRKAERLAAAICTQTKIPVELWDESGSTAAARMARIELGVTRKRRKGHLDELAATYILQSYLDAHSRA